MPTLSLFVITLAVIAVSPCEKGMRAISDRFRSVGMDCGTTSNAFRKQAATKVGP